MRNSLTEYNAFYPRIFLFDQGCNKFRIKVTDILLLFVFFWAIPRRLNHPKENKQHSEHGESLQLRYFITVVKATLLYSTINTSILAVLEDWHVVWRAHPVRHAKYRGISIQSVMRTRTVK